ncbi:DUF1207 domain-containing protein [Methylobacter sp.]|uniref:DUF1207 domain-containing protein n=2 Tax=Methylobacter sp. TaxID=2051955 RepID=UPI002489813A|nr:DUF1207 domain-containing protein [Methylobacter sp.]MDI1278263.1 DUF1207 domain-containing protein [Methylobacter sp.]MDI1358983.1 DUF1207 domain-containing protein [Methylobacter sp.]
MIYCRFITVWALMLMPVSFAYATAQDDIYIAGYAAGVLKHSLKLDMPPLIVRDGVITLPVGSLEAAERAKAVQLLWEIPGVNAVKTSESTSQPRESSSANAVQVSGNEAVPATESTLLPTGFLPKDQLFKPLLADTRWAHFSAAYRNYQSKNFDGIDIASVSFGETIPFYRSNFGQSTAQWEAGLQAGVFSDFNLNASSSDLINTDFIASAYSSMRAGQFSAFGRLYHQSSHLGDEFLLRTKLERVNLSYEGVDLKLSYELPYGVRLYGGGGGLFHKEPSALKVWSAQYGIEFRSPWRMDFASMRPIVAADIKHYDENNWSTDISARAGVEFENLQVLGRKLQILVEYYNGFTPSGQFYKEKVEYIGLGAHYHF